jgi:hypothetical protein
VPRFKVGEKLPGGAESAAPGVLQALACALARVGLVDAVELMLVRFRVLFALERDHDGRLAVLKLFHEPGGVALISGSERNRSPCGHGPFFHILRQFLHRSSVGFPSGRVKPSCSDWEVSAAREPSQEIQHSAEPYKGVI